VLYIISRVLTLLARARNDDEVSADTSGQKCETEVKTNSATITAINVISGRDAVES